MKSLRPYQFNAVSECLAALNDDDKPVLLMASVGSGKSLMIASILMEIQKSKKRALCLVHNSELVRNNKETFVSFGGGASIYCSSLGEKNSNGQIVFGSPQSILNGINRNEDISKIKFNLIIVDEAHSINYINHRSVFMRIFNHYKANYKKMRLLGATGTNFRFKGESIVGRDCLFKKQVGNITTEYLIKNNYLVKPCFHVDDSLMIDFSKVSLKSSGRFDQKELRIVVEKNQRLTKLICEQIIHIVEKQKRYGVFLFASTKNHAYEILSYLPQSQSSLILGDTKQEDRIRILENARKGIIKYLVNISIISVGVDIPSYDTIAYLRPTESLVLMVQTMGRALRLSPSTAKSDALILDFAGNIERHRDWENPLIEDAAAKTVDKNKPMIIECPKCHEMNTENSRRCIGHELNFSESKNEDKNYKVNNKRCDYYFEFKECPNIKCKLKNDIASRHCYSCGQEIIDPNKKLKLDRIRNNKVQYDVEEWSRSISCKNKNLYINIQYFTSNKEVFHENYYINSTYSQHIFYHKFVKQHLDKPSKWFMHLENKEMMKIMLAEANKPVKISVKKLSSKYTISNKIFEGLNDK